MIISELNTAIKIKLQTENDHEKSVFFKKMIFWAYNLRN